jgi:hypothetical protein
LSNNQKRLRVQFAVSLQVELERAQRRNWAEFYTDDESRVLWTNFPKECRLSLDDEFPERNRYSIEAEKSLLTNFQSEWIRYCGFSATGDSFTAQYFTDQISKPFSQEHFMKLADIALRSLGLHFDNYGYHTAKIVSEEMTCLKCKRLPHSPYSPDLAITDLYLFDAFKQKLQGIDVNDDKSLKIEF